jgi:hypothetical protein
MGRVAEAESLGSVRWIWLGTVAVAAVAATVVLLVAHGGSSGATSPASATGIEASLDHKAIDFGDPVTASVMVSAPRDATIRVQQDLSPLTQLGRTRITRVARGDSQTVTYAAKGSCLDERCLARSGAKRVALRPAIVTVNGEKTRKSWPILSVQRRVSLADAARTQPPMRSDTSPPAVSYRVSPGRLATLLTVLAAVLAVAGALLAGLSAVALYRKRRKPARLTELERALALARNAEGRPSPDRRRALGLLARLLGPRDPLLADEADELAWSKPEPTPAAVADLIADVRAKAR